MSGKVIQHPSAEERRREVLERFMTLRDQHTAACNRMWAGTLACYFTQEDIDLLKVNNFLSEYDRALLEATQSQRAPSYIKL